VPGTKLKELKAQSERISSTKAGINDNASQISKSFAEPERGTSVLFVTKEIPLIEIPSSPHTPSYITNRKVPPPPPHHYQRKWSRKEGSNG
jgi:hypothetical protein